MRKFQGYGGCHLGFIWQDISLWTTHPGVNGVFVHHDVSQHFSSVKKLFEAKIVWNTWARKEEGLNSVNGVSHQRALTFGEVSRYPSLSKVFRTIILVSTVAFAPGTLLKYYLDGGSKVSEQREKKFMSRVTTGAFYKPSGLKLIQDEACRVHAAATYFIFASFTFLYHCIHNIKIQLLMWLKRVWLMRQECPATAFQCQYETFWTCLVLS